jgi:hypothetical protein
VSIPRVLVVSAWLAVAFGGCSQVDVVGTPEDLPIGEGGVAGEGRAGSGSLAGDGAGGNGGKGITQGGAPGFVDVAIWPTYAATPDSGDAEAVLAAVTTLSAGSLTLPIHARWNELSGATGTPRALAWQRLDAVTKPYRDRDGRLALCIDIVDRTLPAWPFAGPLDETVAVSAIERTLVEVFARYAGDLSLLCFGYELDRYVAVASSTERERLRVVLKRAIAYADEHGPRGLRIGVAVTLDALVSPDAAVDELRHLGNEVVAVYDPLDASGQLKEPGSVAGELVAALATIRERDPDPRPLSLFEVGYPSSSDAGASEQAQRDYFAALFAELDGQRDDVSFVGVYGLGDRAEHDCEAEMAAFGEPTEMGAAPEQAAQELSSVRALARCSMGLRAENAEPKLAWPAVLGALSRYAP